MEFYGKSFPEAVQMLTGESGEGQTEATTAPVSYTHLDVYKRQGLGCGLDVIGCGTEIVVRTDRSLGYSIPRGRVGSGIDNI